MNQISFRREGEKILSRKVLSFDSVWNCSIFGNGIDGSYHITYTKVTLLMTFCWHGLCCVSQTSQAWWGPAWYGKDEGDHPADQRHWRDGGHFVSTQDSGDQADIWSSAQLYPGSAWWSGMLALPLVVWLILIYMGHMESSASTSSSLRSAVLDMTECIWTLAVFYCTLCVSLSFTVSVSFLKFYLWGRNLLLFNWQL